MNEERIRKLLREGDPFAGEAGLNPEEVREMRRTVLTAIPGRRERRLLPALALAGAAAVAVLIAVLVLRQNPGGTPKPAPPPQRAGMAAVPVPVPPSPAPVAEAAPREETRTAQARPRHRRASIRHPRTQDSVASLKASEEPKETVVREIQFTTPGGTRILWTVAPGKASY